MLLGNVDSGILFKSICLFVLVHVPSCFGVSLVDIADLERSREKGWNDIGGAYIIYLLNVDQRMIGKKMLTVFTPAYNRAHTIGRTYESLCRQTCQDFEWLVIDDGSSDHTKELVEGWIKENKIPIRYIYQNNQGMHGAHNTAYRNIHTELNTCIDSDDYMPDDAVEKIISFWNQYGSDKYAGFIGLDRADSGDIIGTVFLKM